MANFEVRHSHKKECYFSPYRAKWSELKKQYQDSIVICSCVGGVISFNEDADILRDLCDNLGGSYIDGIDWAFCRIIAGVDDVLPKLVRAGHRVAVFNMF